MSLRGRRTPGAVVDADMKENSAAATIPKLTYLSMRVQNSNTHSVSVSIRLLCA